MLIDNEVVVDQWTDYLFSFGVYFGAIDDVAIFENNSETTSIFCTPNPASSAILLHADAPFNQVQILDHFGRLIISISEVVDHQTIDISSLAPGSYFVHARSPQNHLYNGKFIKVDWSTPL